MFSYILVVSTSYILLISICPMLKIGKLAILAILFKNYFKGGKNMVTFYSTVQKFHWLFCVGSRHWVDFKIESVLSNAKIKKIKFYILLMKKWEQLPLTLDNSKSEERRGDYLDNKQIYSRQWKCEFLNVIFYRFCSEGTSDEIVWFLECFQQGFVWSSIFWVFKLSRVHEFPNFSPQIK